MFHTTFFVPFQKPIPAPHLGQGYSARFFAADPFGYPDLR
jgi:hypothetical protein